MDPLRALALQVEWGADEALAATPMSRLRAAVGQAGPPPAAATKPAAIVPPVAAATVPAVAAATVPPIAAATVAPFNLRRAASDGEPGDWAEWVAGLTQSEGGGLAQTAAHLLLPVGQGRLLIVAEAPGDSEDRSGEAFSGPPGQLLRRMLASIGVGFAEATFAYLVPWRPPGERAPSDSEIRACLPFLHGLIRLRQASRLVAAGTPVARALLGENARRGRWGEAEIAGLGRRLPVLPTISPAVLLRQPLRKAVAWADLRALRHTLDADTTA